MNLQDEGFRFVFSAGDYSWTHPLTVPADAVDCTDMGDAEFCAFVLDHVEVAA